MTTTLAETREAGPDDRDGLLATARSLGSLIRDHVEEAERARRLSPEVIGALAESGLFRLLLPRSLGGLEVDPVTCSLVIEEIARFDSAAGWALQAGNRFEAVGQVYCGVPPEFAMVAF